MSSRREEQNLAAHQERPGDLAEPAAQEVSLILFEKKSVRLVKKEGQTGSARTSAFVPRNESQDHVVE